ncbi:MAG: hypothetical protein WBC17_04825, partial [Mycobacterium sp.]
GIDEDTALVGEPSTQEPTLDDDAESGLETWQFRARGRQSAWRIEADRRYRVTSALGLRVNTGN